VTVTRRCPGCLLAALLISATVHLAVAAALLWSAGGGGAADPGSDQVGVTLAMFGDALPAGLAAAAPPAPDSDIASGPEDEAAQEASAVPPEPLATPMPQPAVSPAPSQPPPPSASKPAPTPKTRTKPQQAKRFAKVVRDPAPEQPVRPRMAAGSQTTDGAASRVAGGGGAGGGAHAKALEGEYLQGLQQAIARNRFYPLGARREEMKGVVTVAFTVQEDGRLGDIRVVKGSGFETLDGAAVETLRRVGAYRPIPDGIGRSRWPVRVPIVFDLR
jgi:periplasmic protein TonB